MNYPERKISQCILPLRSFNVNYSLELSLVCPTVLLPSTPSLSPARTPMDAANFFVLDKILENFKIIGGNDVIGGGCCD